MDAAALARSLIASDRFARLGRRERLRAKHSLEQAIACPGDLAAIHVATALLQANEAFAAVALLEQVPPKTPGLAEALAGAYRRDARYEDAIRAARLAPPGRAVLYEKAMAHSALGHAEEALAIFEQVLAQDSGHAASWFGSHAPALHLNGINDCLRRIERACGCDGANGKYWAFAYAYRRLLGMTTDRNRVDEDSRRRPLADSVDALMPHLAADPAIMGLSAPLLRWAISQATEPGLVLEFGVRRGTSITIIAEAARQEVHGFDSFEGLPEGWGNEQAGVLTTGRQLPPVPPNVTLHAGWFDDTLAPFLDAHPGPVRLLNIDSDIYSSARTVLCGLADRMRPGTILVFDEFIGNRTWADDEYRAFHEFIAATGFGFEYLAIGPATKQVVVRLR